MEQVLRLIAVDGGCIMKNVGYLVTVCRIDVVTDIVHSVAVRGIGYLIHAAVY